MAPSDNGVTSEAVPPILGRNDHAFGLQHQGEVEIDAVLVRILRRLEVSAGL
jgi:hypothetical protein